MQRRSLALVLAPVALASIIAFGGPNAAHAQDHLDPSKIEIKTTTVTPGVFMLEGAGGNIGLSVGDDGVFMIDDEFAPLAPKLKAAIAKLSPKPLRFIFNTHWHGDHTGGNEAMSSGGAIIVAHDNVRKRMSTAQFSALMNRHTPASPAKALPIVTFNDEAGFHLNGDDIRVYHVANAHTDGDCVVRFEKANVIHTGDVFMNGFYPLIDTSTGGSIDGYIAAQEKVLSLSDANTKIIPGHGPLGDKAALQREHDMLKGLRSAVAHASEGGKSLAQVLAAKPSAPWDAKWGHGFIKPDTMVTFIYDSLPRPFVYEH